MFETRDVTNTTRLTELMLTIDCYPELKYSHIVRAGASPISRSQTSSTRAPSRASRSLMFASSCRSRDRRCGQWLRSRPTTRGCSHRGSGMFIMCQLRLAGHGQQTADLVYLARGNVRDSSSHLVDAWSHTISPWPISHHQPMALT